MTLSGKPRRGWVQVQCKGQGCGAPNRLRMLGLFHKKCWDLFR